MDNSRYNYSHSHASKVIFKILQTRLQQYMSQELPGVQAGFRKGRGIRHQIANICWIIEKQENSRKTSASLTVLKPLTVWITANCGRFFRRWKYHISLPASWETCMQAKKQQLELDMEQWTGSKSGKEYNKAVYCHPTYLTFMECTSCKILGWMNHRLKSRFLGEILTTSDVQIIPPNGRKWRGTKELHNEVKEESEKAGLKLNTEKTKIMPFSPITSWQIGKKMETVANFIF